MAERMTPRQAAAQWLEADRAIRATGADALIKKRDAAAKVVKAHMEAKGVARYAGIVRLVGSGGKRLVPALVLEHLGAEKYGACERETPRVSLVDAAGPAK